MSTKEVSQPVLSDQLRARLENRTAKIGIMGLGYVGLPLALLFTEEKFPVTGFDVDKKKVEVRPALNRFRSGNRKRRFRVHGRASSGHAKLLRRTHHGVDIVPLVGLLVEDAFQAELRKQKFESLGRSLEA